MNELKLLFIAIIVFSIAASADIKINEIVPKGGTEWVELYNTSASTGSIQDYWLMDDDGNGIVLSGLITGYGFHVVDILSPILDNEGDLLFLINPIPVPDTLDQVGFGIQGGAPGAPYIPLFSIARIIDGLDTDDDARDFNLDATPTLGATNDPDSVLLGSSLIINEIRPYPTSGGDSVELYNPTGTPYDIQGWFLSDGDDYESIVTDITVPAGGFAVLDCDVDLSAIVNFTDYDVWYLFMDDSVRIDQLGWAGEHNDSSFQRYPDGVGPNDGYDWVSSGGGITLFDWPPTWGGQNSGIEEEDIPFGYKLNVPGIVKGKISIQYAIPERIYITISIFDQLGRLISILIDETQNPGYYSVSLNRKSIPSGIYFVVVKSSSFESIKKLTLMR
ncbi:MAG: T9SS type A sorting domain-containing protein [Candidatus Stahlbacteria bacterium]|nr:MAG: T9SS type A sorting domain-containing protein [Candidatus Stahlbacteria bacterium]